jgi:hypothetical protein
MRYLIAALVLVASPAYAQTLTNTQKVFWTAPIQYVNGTAIPSTVTITYNVYAKLAGAADARLRTGVVGTSIITQLFPVGQSNCYTVTVLLNGANESPRSPEICGVVQAVTSKPVTGLTVQ